MSGTTFSPTDLSHAVVTTAPAPFVPRKRTLQIGTAAFTAMWVMYFGGLFASYISSRNTCKLGQQGVEASGGTAASWIPDSAQVELTAPTIMAWTLLMSLVTMQWAVYSFKRSDRRHGLIALATQAMFGAAVINQVVFQWKQLGLEIDDSSGSAASSLIYAITASHVAMIVVAMCLLAFAAFRALASSDTKDHVDVVASAATFWYAMVGLYFIIWILIFITKQAAVFTPGFKLFAGMATLGLIGAFVYGLSSGNVITDLTGAGVDDPTYFGFVDRNAVIGLLSLGWKGNIGGASGVIVLLFMSISAALIGGTVVAFRDADVESVAELGDTPSVMPLAQRPTAPSWWPATTAVGMGVLLIGLVMETKAFWIIGLVLLSTVAIEWALTAWADRSTGDADTNLALRDRVGAAFEIPVLGLALGAVLALSVSRMFIWATGNVAVIIAGVLSLIIIAIALLAAFRPQIGRRALGGIVGVVAVAVIGIGILTAVIDPRVDHHGEHSEDHSSESHSE